MDTVDVTTAARQHSAQCLWVERLLLTNFRNYVSATLTFGPSPVVLVGQNGAGKTNLMEAVSLLASGHGLRQATYADLARVGGPGGWSVAATLHAAGGPFGIDQRVNADDSGIWKRRNQLLLAQATAVIVVAGALWEGDQTRLGHTAWQTVDSLAIAAVSAQALKLAFSRSRPTQTDNPNEWFKGHGHKSFPSGEVTEIASAITPIVLEYGAEHPVVYALELLPLYDAVARVKARAHWQSDVLAGFVLGTAVGLYTHSRPSSIFVEVLPHGVSVGWRTRF